MNGTTRIFLAALLSLLPTINTDGKQLFQTEQVVRSCDVDRTSCQTEAVGLYQGNGQMGCSYGPLGLHLNTDYTNRYGETKLLNLSHRVRARYHHDYVVPLLQIYWTDTPTDLQDYSQRQNFYDATVTTRFTSAGISYQVRSWFDPVEKNLGFITIQSSEAGRQVTIDPMDHPQAHYGQHMLQDVTVEELRKGEYKITVNCSRYEQNGIHPCDIPKCSQVYISTNADIRVTGNNLLLTLRKGSNHIRISYGKPSATTAPASLSQTKAWWHERWDNMGMLSLTDPQAEQTWVRSVAMFLSSYDDQKNGLCPPLGFTGTNWSFYYPQDVSYVHPILLSTGNLGIARSWIEKWASELEGQRMYTRRIWHHNGVMIPWVYPYNGFEGYHADGFPMHTYGQIHQGAYYVRMALETANLVNEPRWTEQYAIPVLRGVAEFYADIASRHADGLWHFHCTPSCGQDEFGGDDKTDYIDVLYSAKYVLQQAVRHGIDPDGKYSTILRDGIAFPALLDSTGRYYYAYLGGEGTWGRQKHPAQLNELLYLQVDTAPTRPAVYVYKHRNDMTVDARKPFYWGWSLGAFLLAGSRLGATEEWKADWQNMRRSDYVDPEWIQSYETSTHWNMSYYNINNGLIAQSLLSNLVSDWYGSLEIGKCNPWPGRQYVRNILTQTGVSVSGSIEGSSYDVVLTAWKDCTFTIKGETVSLLKGQSRRFRYAGTEQDCTLKVTQCRTTGQVQLDYYTPQLGVMDSIAIDLPGAMQATLDNTYINVIGRGEVSLARLQSQSVGRHGDASGRNRVGVAEIQPTATGTRILLRDIDLRPCNSPALTLRFTGAGLKKGRQYTIQSRYLLSKDYTLPADKQGEAYCTGDGNWSPVSTQRFTYGKWAPRVTHQPHDIAEFGIKADTGVDVTDLLNNAITQLSEKGGGCICFDKGTYLVRTVRLKSHVWLSLQSGTIIRMNGRSAGPEPTWFKDYSPNAGSNGLDTDPYSEPDNYLVKQDFGHSFFRNGMFVAERQQDIRVFGPGRISGNGFLRTGNREHTDKMFVFKQCRDVEVGGTSNGKDLWYDEQRNDICYTTEDGTSTTDTGNMLDIDGGGHFVILATGTDSIRVHDVYCGRNNLDNARDIFDFMGCRQVTVTNIFSYTNGDDIVKLGSDCSLGFTRPSRQVYVRNIVGDTHCNLFQIGSETADDIQQVYVDNLYVLGTDKAGFSISSNDGGTVSDVWLNSGKTGWLHPSSIFRHTRTPFFFSIANRGRVIGSTARAFNYTDAGQARHELLATNIPIGRVSHIHVAHVNITDVYAGSRNRQKTWPVYNGQADAPIIVAGYKLPDDAHVEGGLRFTLPDGAMKRDVTDIWFDDIHATFKGGFQGDVSTLTPPEMGMGKFNIRDFGTPPAYGIWARHADGVSVTDCTFQLEKADTRPCFSFDDTIHQHISQVQQDTNTGDREVPVR